MCEFENVNDSQIKLKCQNKNETSCAYILKVLERSSSYLAPVTHKKGCNGQVYSKNRLYTISVIIYKVMLIPT